MSTQEQQRVSILFTGILVCVPLLALHRFGLFPEMAAWLGARLPRLLVLPEEGVRMSLPLQYGFFTLLAFLSARVGFTRGGLWLKGVYLIALSYLTLTLTVTLAWAGVLFEPFSGLAAAWAACLLGVIVADLEQRREEAQASAPQDAGPPEAAEPLPEPEAAAATAEKPAKQGPVIVAKA